MAAGRGGEKQRPGPTMADHRTPLPSHTGGALEHGFGSPVCIQGWRGPGNMMESGDNMKEHLIWPGDRLNTE